VIVRYSGHFTRAFRKLSDAQKKAVHDTLAVFFKEPLHVSLRNHKLTGAFLGLRSISAAKDLRIIYREERGHAVILFVNAGTHDQVYQ
jgi:addiction module RelE/StbE family toxin